MKLNFARVSAQLARIHGDREALVNVERGRRYTFRQLHSLTNRIANMMRERLHLERGDIFLCILENDNLSLLHILTALKGEATAAWTNIRDSADEHLWQFDFLRPKVVFLENALVDRYYSALRERSITVVCMDAPAEMREGLIGFWDLMEGISDADPGVESDVHEDIVALRFTGGTTGRGKCAQYTADNWLACSDSFLSAPETLLDAGTRFLKATPISHAAGLTILPTFMRGGCAVTQNTPDLTAWRRNVESERITAALMIPTLLYRLLDLGEDGAPDLSSLKTVFYGAAPMSPAKLAQLRARFGDVFVQLYGSTECLQAVARLDKAEHAPTTSGASSRLASAGRVSPEVEVVIVGEDGIELPEGEPGEIWIRGRATIKGYYGNPEGTAAEFTGGFWKSGDIGYRDADGFLYIVDRKKDMIITGGFNVYAAEVESALNAHPAVVMSAVVGVPHEEWGESVHAEVILKSDAPEDAGALIAHVKSRLGAFKAPKTITFISDLPLTPAQKVLRRVVREKYWAGQKRSVS